MCSLHPTMGSITWPPPRHHRHHVPPFITERSLLCRRNVISPAQAVHFSLQLNRTWFHQSWPLNYKWRRWLLPERVRQRAEMVYTPSCCHHHHGQSLITERMPLFVSLHFIATHWDAIKEIKVKKTARYCTFKGFLFVSLPFFSFICCVLMECTLTAVSPACKWERLPLSGPSCPPITALAVSLSEWWIIPD